MAASAWSVIRSMACSYYVIFRVTCGICKERYDKGDENDVLVHGPGRCFPPIGR